jgi:hypothetical protein
MRVRVSASWRVVEPLRSMSSCRSPSILSGRNLLRFADPGALDCIEKGSPDGPMGRKAGAGQGVSDT